MKRRPSIEDQADSVPYPVRRVGVARPARQFPEPGRTISPLHDPSSAAGDLPELTDAWFEETIRHVEDASLRLKRARRS